jgi:transcriptional regulator with XRE-family HTH domain
MPVLSPENRPENLDDYSDHSLQPGITMGSAIGSTLTPGLSLVIRSTLAKSGSGKGKTDIPTDPKQRLAYYVKTLRGVSPDNPAGNVSQRKLARQFNINVASIRAYEDEESDPNRVNAQYIRKLATAGGITEAELRSWLNNKRYKGVELEEVLATIRNTENLNSLLQILEETAAQIKFITMDNPIVPSDDSPDQDDSEDELPFPAVNQTILDGLAETQKRLGLDDEKFAQFCEMLSVSHSDIEWVEAGEDIDLVLLGHFARLLNVPLDELIAIRDSDLALDPNAVEDGEVEDDEDDDEGDISPAPTSSKPKSPTPSKASTKSRGTQTKSKAQPRSRKR